MALLLEVVKEFVFGIITINHPIYKINLIGLTKKQSV